jgi:hypothetical protein
MQMVDLVDLHRSCTVLYSVYMVYTYNRYIYIYSFLTRG